MAQRSGAVDRLELGPERLVRDDTSHQPSARAIEFVGEHDLGGSDHADRWRASLREVRIRVAVSEQVYGARYGTT